MFGAVERAFEIALERAKPLGGMRLGIFQYRKVMNRDDARLRIARKEVIGTMDKALTKAAHCPAASHQTRDANGTTRRIAEKPRLRAVDEAPIREKADPIDSGLLRDHPA